MTAAPTWLLMTRDVSDTIRVADTPHLIATMILDMDSGLARGANIAATAPEARTRAMSIALTQPAGPLPPSLPAMVICTGGDADQAEAELAQLLPGQAPPQVRNGTPIDEAEDIFDSFVGHMAGRRQPSHPPEPDDWRLLLTLAHDYASAQPWQRWADDQPMDLTVKIGKMPRRYVAVVIGQEGIQRGLVCYPGTALPPGLPDWQPDQPVPLPAGTLLLWLDPPAEVPPEFAAKARRYGWPPDTDLLPVALTASRTGPADLDQPAAQRLALAITAVLDHYDQQPNTQAPATGRLRLANGDTGTYTIHDAR